MAILAEIGSKHETWGGGRDMVAQFMLRTFGRNQQSSVLGEHIMLRYPRMISSKDNGFWACKETQRRAFDYLARMEVKSNMRRQLPALVISVTGSR